MLSLIAYGAFLRILIPTDLCIRSTLVITKDSTPTVTTRSPLAPSVMSSSRKERMSIPPKSVVNAETNIALSAQTSVTSLATVNK